MRVAFRFLRRAAMIALAGASIAGAGALIWVFVAGEGSRELSNAHLAAILALAVLPVATVAAWILDGKTAREQPVLEDNGLFERPPGIQVVEEPAVGGTGVPPVRPDSTGPSGTVVDRATDSTGSSGRVSANRPRQLHQPHRRRHGRRAAGRRQ